MNPQHRLRLAPVTPPQSPFDLHRAAIIERATLELASGMVKRAAESAAKAASLMGTASALPERRKALRDGPDGWLEALKDAQVLLAQCMEELG